MAVRIGGQLFIRFGWGYGERRCGERDDNTSCDRRRDRASCRDCDDELACDSGDAAGPCTDNGTGRPEGRCDDRGARRACGNKSDCNGEKSDCADRHSGCDRQDRKDDHRKGRRGGGCDRDDKDGSGLHRLLRRIFD
ncbi:MAG: hypothetical protein LC792_24340 [Actinobacteria bacterium]|nr:hypothetical protein [Actinomycetota bacterium]